MGKYIVIKNPRIGVCNLCRAVKGFDCKRTQMHHDNDIYNINNPIKNTIELCVICHNKTKNVFGHNKKSVD